MSGYGSTRACKVRPTLRRDRAPTTPRITRHLDRVARMEMSGSFFERQRRYSPKPSSASSSNSSSSPSPSDAACASPVYILKSSPSPAHTGCTIRFKRESTADGVSTRMGCTGDRQSIGEVHTTDLPSKHQLFPVGRLRCHIFEILSGGTGPMKLTEGLWNFFAQLVSRAETQKFADHAREGIQQLTRPCASRQICAACCVDFTTQDLRRGGNG